MGFNELSIDIRYRTDEHSFAKDFLIPVLSHTVLYKRAVGFFSSTALIEMSYGLFEMAKNGGKIQLITSPMLSDEDIEAIRYGYKTRSEVINNALSNNIFDPIDEYEEERLNLIATLVANDTLELKLAFMEEDTYKNIYHEKIAVFEDAYGNHIATTGSANESENAYRYNFESIYVFCDWKDETNCRFVEQASSDFDRMWNDNTEKIRVIPFPNVVLDRLKSFKKENVDYDTDKKQFCYHEFVMPQSLFRVPEYINLRDIQKEAIANWFNQGSRGIFSMCTGSGKSYTALACMVELARKVDDKLAVFIVCPQLHLAQQWEDDVVEWGPDPIMAHSGVSGWKEKLITAYKQFRNKGTAFICITSNDTFVGETITEIVSRFTEEQHVLLIVDEAHNFGATKISRCMPENIKYRIALSATIERFGDKTGTQALFNYFGEKCIEYDIEQAISDCVLTRYRYYPIPVYLDEDELITYKVLTDRLRKFMIEENGKVKISKDGELLLFKRARLLAGARNKQEKLMELMKPYKHDSHILVYCGATTIEGNDGEDIRQVDEVTKKIRLELGMKAHRFTAEEDTRQRQELKHLFANGDYQVMTAIKCLDEGINIPAIKTAFILASTRNPKEFIQRRGRLLRRSEGKDLAEIYDMVVLPRDLSLVDRDDFNQDRSIVIGELIRVHEFGRLSDNPSEANGLMNKIMNAYDVFIDVEEEIKHMEE